jgi:hypothetical protein
MENTQIQTQPAGRQNRAVREADSRAVMQRPTAWRAPETLPSPDPRDGWRHRWVRVSILGNADPSNISSKLREGYEPCKAEDYPELMLHAVNEGRFKGNIEVGGLLLCRVPEEFMAQRAQHFERQNQAQVESVDNSFLRQSDSRMPLFAEKSTKVSFGSGS